MSEYYAVQRSSEHLEHYGVKGMKWGVRKYAADKYARPSKKFYDRYVNNKKKTPSARTMTRDLNNFGKSQRNIEKSKQKDGFAVGRILTGNGPSYELAHLIDSGRTKATQQANISQMQGAIRAAAKKAGYKETKKMGKPFKDKNGYLTIPYKVKYSANVKSRREKKADKYKKRSDAWRSTEKDMRNWAERTTRPGEARTNYLKVAKRASKKAKQYERKYLRIRGKANE